MRLIDLKRVPDYEVEEWLFKMIPYLTKEQKLRIQQEEIVRFSSLYFMKRTKKTNNIFLRFTIIFIPFVFLLILIGLPINFIITGKWGYGDWMKWYGKWINACGL